MTDLVTEPATARPWHWRPATRAGVVAWWALSLVVTWGAALLVGVVVGIVVYLGTGHSRAFADLDALFYGVGAFVAVGYLLLLASSVLLARRYVPPESRSPGWVGSLVALLVVGAVLAVVAMARFDQLLLVTTAAVLAVGVPSLVVPRVPRVPREQLEQRAPHAP